MRHYFYKCGAEDCDYKEVLSDEDIKVAVEGFGGNLPESECPYCGRTGSMKRKEVRRVESGLVLYVDMEDFDTAREILNVIGDGLVDEMDNGTNLVDWGWGNTNEK